MKATQERVSSLLADHRLLSEQVKSERKTQIDLQNQLTFAEGAQEVIQHVAQATQQEAHSRISSVVSRCLEAVFDEPYEFQIEFERKRGKTEANLRFVRDGMSIDPLTSSGGGVIDVAAFALRLSCLMLTRPPLRRVLLLDEPFKYLSADYIPRVRELLQALSQEMEMQFIMVTHIDGLRCGKVIEL